MDETRFTPGPWKAQKVDGASETLLDEYEIQSLAPGTVGPIALVSGPEDAAMVTAAPAMYEALEIVMRLSGSYVAEHPVIAKKVNAALAAARGEGGPTDV